MATTLSAANCNAAPRVLHEGVFSQTFRFDSNGLSLSVSDVIVLGYIQQGVQVLSGFVWGSDGSAAPTYRFGVGSTDNNLSTAVTLSAAGTNALLGFVPKSFSLSADAEGNLKLQVTCTRASGSSTATGSINLTLLMQALPI